jgi:5-methyltetrahydropteroyltriglutamate--homocysteine methyltransferase
MVEAHLTGAFPRSEGLVEATRAAERGKISETEVKDAFDQDVTSLIELQRNASLDSFVDGQLNWQDLFRPFSEFFTGIRLGRLVRWFDNNTFYRQPVIVDKVNIRSTEVRQFFRYGFMPSQAAKRAVLPGPFTFAVLAQNSAYTSFSDLVDDLAHALKHIVVSLQNAGYSYVQFNEPALCLKGRTKQDLELARLGLETCAKVFSGRTILQIYFASAGSIIGSLLDCPVSCIGLDFYATPIESLPECDFEKELGCGCIDGRNSLLETAVDVRNFVLKVDDVLEPRGIVLCPNCDLDFLPRTIAEKKVRVLAEAKARLTD